VEVVMVVVAVAVGGVVCGGFRCGLAGGVRAEPEHKAVGIATQPQKKQKTARTFRKNA